MINRIVLVGRLTKDPAELRRSQSGVALTSFTLAVDNRYSKEGKADFIPVVVFNKTAEIVSSFARKGTLVGVEGRLQQRTYENKENQKVSVIEVVADNVQLLESKSVNESRLQSQTGGYQPQPVVNNSINQTRQNNFDAQDNGFDNGYDVSDDDLPF